MKITTLPKAGTLTLRGVALAATDLPKTVTKSAPTNNDDAMAWNRAYRALEHGDARSKFRHAGHMEHFPRAVREFADTFNELQRERQTAD